MRLAVVRGGCVSSDCLLGRYSRVGGFHLVGVGLAQWQEGQVGLGVLGGYRVGWFGLVAVVAFGGWKQQWFGQLQGRQLLRGCGGGF